MLLMLCIAVPMYVCATASTPIAAALAFKGISPGAALVFLLAGPATNIASLTVISQILGKKATSIYLASIVICSLAMGMAANFLYELFGLNVHSWVNKNSMEHHSLFSGICAIALLLLICNSILKKQLSSKQSCCDHHNH